MKVQATFLQIVNYHYYANKGVITNLDGCSHHPCHLFLPVRGIVIQGKYNGAFFQDTLKAMLINKKLNINFRPHYSPDKFWEHMVKKAEFGVGLKYVKCHFDYPNMAEDAKLLGSYFEEFGVDINAEMDYTIKGQHGQPLNCDPKNRNKHLESIIEYGGKTGNKVQSGYMDNSKQTYDADHVGISTLVAEEKIRKCIQQMVKEILVEGGTPRLPLDDDNAQLRDALALWLRALNE